MAKATFYYAGTFVAGDSIELGADEVKHAFSVRRLKQGHAVQVINGFGLLGEAEVLVLEKRQFVVNIVTASSTPTPPKFIVATAVPKGDRQRFMVESLTQLGVTDIVPLDCEFSATGADHKSVQKWPRYAIEAAKQSSNTWVPRVLSGSTCDQLQSHFGSDTGYWVADAAGVWPLPAANERAEPPNNTNNICVAIGPEGGFSAPEQRILVNGGFQPCRLGAHILRTETAAIVAAALLRWPNS